MQRKFVAQIIQGILEDRTTNHYSKKNQENLLCFGFPEQKVVIELSKADFQLISDGTFTCWYSFVQ